MNAILKSNIFVFIALTLCHDQCPASLIVLMVYIYVSGCGGGVYFPPLLYPGKHLWVIPSASVQYMELGSVHRVQGKGPRLMLSQFPSISISFNIFFTNSFTQFVKMHLLVLVSYLINKLKRASRYNRVHYTI